MTSRVKQAGEAPPIARMVGFSALPIISAAAPFVLLPLLAHRVSPAEWAGLGVGQSIGMMAAIAVMLGWQLFGPTALAHTGPLEKQGWYLQSLASRLLAALVVIPISAVGSALVTPVGGRTLAVCMTAAIAISGLNPAWWFIATGKPSGIAIWDTAPRVLATLACAPLVVLGASPLIYAAALALASTVAVGLFSFRVLRGFAARQYLLSPLFRSRLRLAVVPVSTELASNAYSSGATALFSIKGSIGEIAAFSSFYRLYRLGTYVAASVVQAMQSWVVEPPDCRVRATRMRRAVLAVSIMGVVGGLIAWAVLPGLSRLLFTESYAIDATTAAFAGLALAAWSACTSMGRHILVPCGESANYLRATLWSAVLGVPAMIAAPWVGGEEMGALALALSQCVCLCLLAWKSIACLRTLEGLGEEAQQL